VERIRFAPLSGKELMFHETVATFQMFQLFHRGELFMIALDAIEVTAGHYNGATLPHILPHSY
jgi:hypothetical protein